MGPKIEAALGYLERGGKLLIITSPERIAEALQGLAGTRIAPTPELPKSPVRVTLRSQMGVIKWRNSGRAV